MLTFLWYQKKCYRIRGYFMGNSHKDQPFGCTHRFADVGNRVHTRNDSDEDVRVNAYNQAIALWLYLGLSLYKHSFCIKTQASISHGR